MKYQRNQRVHLTHPKFLTTTWLLSTLTLLWATLAWAIAIPPAWQDQLQETGTARVIVVLNVPVQPEGTLNEADAIVAQRAQIAQAQQLLLDSLQPKGSADMRFETIPALVMVADSQTLTQLQDHPLVTSLQLDTADEAMAGQTVADQLKDLEQVYETSPSYAQMATVTVSPASAREGDVRELMVANLQSVGITVARGEESSSGRQVRAANPGTPTASCGGITAGLVLCLPVDGNANDSSGRGNNGVAKGRAVTYVPGKFGQAAKFTDGYIEVPNIKDFVFTNQSLTFSAWTTIAHNYKYVYIPFISLGGGGGDLIHLVKDRQGINDGRIEMVIQNKADAFSLETGDELLGKYQNDWLHVVGVVDYENHVVKLYLNGQLQNTAELKDNFQVSSQASLFIGYSVCCTHGDIYYDYQDGLMDDVRIYNRALSEVEIKQLAFSCGNVTGIPKTECETLVNLYNNTQGTGWKDSATNNWLQTNTPCSWTGVTCANGHVTKITRLAQNLVGVLPDLSALTALQSIVLGQNGLTGVIPDLSALTNLQLLNLSFNHFTGTLPDVSKLSKLTSLRLAGNQLTGAIPPALSNLVQLNWLDVSRNKLTGQIPNLDKLTKLTDLGFQINQLEGPIPSLNTLVNLKNLALFNNKALCRDPQNNYAGRPEVVDATLFPICGKVTLSITKTGNGMVTGQGIDCGTDCLNENLAPNTQVTLTAIADPGFAFQGWTGDCTGTEATTTITMDKTKTCTAAFELPVAIGTGCDVVKEGLVACYLFNNDTNDTNGIHDGSGKGNDGTIVKNVKFVDGISGKAIQLDRTGYIRVPDSNSLKVNEHTIAAWVSLSTGGAVVGKLLPGAYTTLHLSARGQKVATGFTTGTEMLNHPVSTTGYVKADGWHFVVLTYDGANVRFYIDGVLDSQTPRSGTVRANDQDMGIGRQCGNPESTGCDDPLGWYGGLIDEVRIYNRAISEAEVKQLYGLGKPTLTVTKIGTGQGQVASSDATINCGATCEAGYALNSTVTLTATPATGATFTQWTGACSGTMATTTVTLDQSKTCTATFDKVIPKYTLTVSKTGTGTGNLTGTGITCGTDCTEDYDANTQVTLTATPDTGSQFVSWGGDCSGTTTTATVTLDKAKSCIANFVPMSTSYTLTVAKAGSGKGTIRAKVTVPLNQNPPPPVILCKATCSTSSSDYSLNNVVTITATPDTGFTVKGWSCNGSYQTAKGDPTLIHVTMDAAKTCTATFE